MTLLKRAQTAIGTENLFLLGGLAVVIIGFSSSTPLFLTGSNFGSMAFQLPVLGLLTLAMMVPILSGGLILAIIFQANIAGLALASVLIKFGGGEAGYGAFALGVLAALIVGALSGFLMGLVVAYLGAHPILASLAMMIFLRGLGEFLTMGGDISGFPPFMGTMGH